MKKETEINKELQKLNKIFEDIPEAKRNLCDGLIQNAAFMAITLRDLQKEVLENGAVISCQSGNGFETVKDNPAQKAYTTMVSRYTAIITQLLDLLPEQERENDELVEFLK